MEDPFGTNLVMDTVIEEIWTHTFPDILMDVTSDSRAAIIFVGNCDADSGKLAGDPKRKGWGSLLGWGNKRRSEPEDQSQNRVTGFWSKPVTEAELDRRLEVVRKAGDVLIDWHSGMGKEALRVVVQAFKKSGVSAEDAPYVATNFLKDFRFIYKNPDATDKKEKGVFMSPMIATTERGLELIKSDSLALGARKKTSLPGYTEKLWGQKTCMWVTSAKCLNDDNWTAILEEAADMVDTSAFMDDEEEEGADSEQYFAFLPPQYGLTFSTIC
ncbi:hypothetical protein BYT27DRAFT_7286327 [Phlegmacium glaucopus]|nr:hypothetical protein BYT27DRAFT_7286327 [Phlegmacium glaucopus]